MKNKNLLLVLLLFGCDHSTSPQPTPSPEQPAVDSSAIGNSSAAATSVPSPDRRRPATDTSIVFQPVTNDSGVSFVYQNGEEAGHFAILESLGGGVGVIDIDRDGREDLFLPGGGTLDQNANPQPAANGVFRNLGAWKFDDVSTDCNAQACKVYSHGAACADFDNDGFTDILVTGYGGLQLYHNLGDGTFAEVSRQRGLLDRLWSSSAAWGDVNADGILDLYVAHYVNWSADHHPFCTGPKEGLREVCPPRDFDPLPDTLFLGSSDGTFQPTEQSFGDTGKGLGVVIADLNQDSRPDVYVTNDTVPNLLYQNTDANQLEDVSLISGSSLSDRGVPDGSMGVHVLDFDNNGHFDLWVANYERESSALYQGHPDMLFRHVSQRTGITAVGAAYVGWGTVCFDADLDGDEDVFISNGHVIRYPRSAPLRQLPLVFENQNGQRFEDVAAAAGPYTSAPHMGRGVGLADFDRDGDQDLIVNHTNEPVELLKNETSAGHFLQIELVGLKATRDAIAAVVTVRNDQHKISRQWVGGGSYASTLSGRLHFGLGVFADPADDSVKPLTVDVQWPNGKLQTIEDVAAGQTILIHQSRPSFTPIANETL